MSDHLDLLLKNFDELFNDDFLAEADETAIETRFQYLKDQCSARQSDFGKLVDELEFRCNSYIAAVSERRGRQASQ